jgi:hypothetical protein
MADKAICTASALGWRRIVIEMRAAHASFSALNRPFVRRQGAAR